MIAAIPVQVSTVGERRIISCRILTDNPCDFLDREMWFFSTQHCRKLVRIQGVSTASDIHASVYDFHYSGGVILADEISEDSVITDSTYEEAIEHLTPIQTVQ